MAYRKGRDFEYRVQKMLKRTGWTVFRFAGSKPLDLLAIKNGQTYFIECKTNKPTKLDIAILQTWAALLEHPIIVFWKENHEIKSRTIYLGSKRKTYIADIEPEIEIIEEAGLGQVLSPTKIALGNPQIYYEELLPVIITHEQIHLILLRLEGFATSKRFDNIFGNFHPSVLLMPPEDWDTTIIRRRVEKWWRRLIE